LRFLLFFGIEWANRLPLKSSKNPRIRFWQKTQGEEEEEEEFFWSLSAIPRTG
jgi:hypothetical protein